MANDIEFWDPSGPTGSTDLTSVMRLYKASKSTLGFLPDSAFSDRGVRQGLVIGRVDGEVAGYVLFDRPRSDVKLIHVCVAESARRSGLARDLVEFVAANNPDRARVVAACRSDYGLENFWRSVGMRPASEKPGRALVGSTLVNWVRPLGAPDLFEAADLASGLPRVALDSNVVSDLFASPRVRRDNREESAALAADWVQAAVTFVVSPEVDFELARHPDEAERRHQQNSASHITRVRSLTDTQRSLEAQLEREVGPLQLARDASLRADIRQIADAIRGGADFFVTNDVNVLRALRSECASSHGIELLRPYELVGRLLGASGDPQFESRLIDSIDLVWRDVESESDEVALAFLNYDGQEKGKSFNRRLRVALASRPRMKVLVLTDSHDRPWALLAYETTATTMRVAILRTPGGHRAQTVSFQLARYLRRLAAASNLSEIVIEDEALPLEVRRSLDRDGYSGPSGSLRAQVVKKVLTVDEVSTSGLTPPISRIDVERVAEAERRYWPLVITRTATPTYAIPIRPRWADLLFGFSQALFSDERKRGLGLSRELVYFCGSRIVIPPGPARLLWYATSDKSADDRLLVARSRLIETYPCRRGSLSFRPPWCADEGGHTWRGQLARRCACHTLRRH
jgi:GNAT superfamily N-acetyltransferase